VRRRAASLDLANRDRPDSQGICFLGKIRYSEFVRHYLGEADGPIREAETGRELGTHRGAWFYTIGQRQGLGLGNGPWYVVARDIERNEIHVSHASHVANRARDRFEVEDMHWITPPSAVGSDGGDLSLKLRHGPERVGCRVSAGAVNLEKAKRLSVWMDSSDRGVAPGQFAVFYHGDVCLGAGKIAGAAQPPRGADGSVKEARPAYV
jgi:tRNA-specific 2-thiouridylase